MTSGMIVEEEVVPRLVVNVLEASEEVYDTVTLFDEVEVFKSSVQAEMKHLTHRLTVGEDRKYLIQYELSGGEILVLAEDMDDPDIFFDAFCLAGEEVCYSKEGDLGAITLMYSLNTASGVIKEIIRLRDEDIEVFT